MSEEATYMAFVEWFRNAGLHLPETAAMLPAIKARYTPEDADFLTGFPLSPTVLADLARMKGMQPDECQTRADGLAREGVLFRISHGDDVYYRLNDAFFVYLRSSFWRGDTSEATRTLASATNKYYYDGLFDDWEHVHHKGLRTLPINETITDKRQILPYEDVVKVIDSLEYHTVSICPCRHRKNMDPDSPDCEHPDEVCLHFGDLGRYCVENGLGREITPDETREILLKASESGLVHGLSNWQEGADTICNCCDCCCMWLEAHHVLGHEGSLSPSNYRVQGNSEECIACFLCEDRCPMHAVQLEDSSLATNSTGQVSVTDLTRCIGCGVCVVTCPVEALTLVRKEETEDSPKDIQEFVMRYMEDRQADSNPHRP
jgi:formate hydrogenlyase subunit 6/NADH:ubiquinone oxidoreductase subunit I